MASVPGFDADPRPELPEVFPDEEITVEAEEKVFEESRTNNSTQPKLVYVLEKAPVKRIESIQGTAQSGENRVFTQGTDYELADLVQNFEETFTFSLRQNRYELDREVDIGSVSIVDEDGTTYTDGVEFVLLQDNEDRTDAVVWQDGEDNPDTEDSFTVSYERTSPNTVVEWDETGSNLPQVGSIFFVTYIADSVLSRYIDAYDEKFTEIKEDIDGAVSNKFVDTADSESLDQLGRLFGPVIGKRRGRTDPEYRKYLKSVVQSFTSRGTKTGIKLAIAAATDVPIEEIEITEDFQRNTYNIVVLPNTPVTVSLIENVAEIADPSGVEQILTRFPLEPESVVVNDVALARDAVESDPDEFFSDDDGFVDRNLFSSADQAASDDAQFIDPNVTVRAEDSVSDDAQFIDKNLSTILDDAVVDDTIASPGAASFEDLASRDEAFDDLNLTEEVENTASTDVIESVEPSDKNAHFWEDDQSTDVTGWNFFEWTEIVDVSVASPVDTVESDDALVVDANKFDSSDASATDDAVVTREVPDVISVEDPGSDDAVAVPRINLVAWDTNDWESLEWTKEQN